MKRILMTILLASVNVWGETASLTAMEQSQVLVELLNRVESVTASGRKAVVIFDLDDTIFDTAERHIKILKEFAADPTYREQFSAAVKKIKKVTPEKTHYHIEDTLKALGVDDSAVAAAVNNFWKARFFENSYLTLDQPNPGALDYVNEIIDRGAIVVYFTGRWEEMRPGTEKSLSQNGFPMSNGGNVHLIMKPEKSQKDEEFKERALASIAAMGEVVGGFENEPRNVNLFKQQFPDGSMIFLDTRHSNKPDIPLEGIPWVNNFVVSKKLLKKSLKK